MIKTLDNWHIDQLNPIVEPMEEHGKNQLFTVKPARKQEKEDKFLLTLEKDYYENTVEKLE